MVNWLHYWGLDADPFSPSGGEYVETPPHRRAIDALNSLVESGERVVRLAGAEGLGKSTVTRQLLGRLRSPRRRVVSVTGGPALAEDLAVALGRSRSAGNPWKGVAEGIKLARWQGYALVIAVDDLDADPAGRADIARLVRVDSHPTGAASYLLVGGAEGEGDEPCVRLLPLTRSESVAYLEAKLSRAGGTASAFDPSALARLHAESFGSPRRLDRLARAALREAASRRVDRVSAEVVEASAGEGAVPGWPDRRRVG